MCAFAMAPTHCNNTRAQSNILSLRREVTRLSHNSLHVRVQLLCNMVQFHIRPTRSLMRCAALWGLFCCMCTAVGLRLLEILVCFLECKYWPTFVCAWPNTLDLLVVVSLLLFVAQAWRRDGFVGKEAARVNPPCLFSLLPSLEVLSERPSFASAAAIAAARAFNFNSYSVQGIKG